MKHLQWQYLIKIDWKLPFAFYLVTYIFDEVVFDFFFNSCFDFTIIEWCSLSTLIVDITKTYQYFM